MPSPFPGMDPHIEAPALWTGFHNRFATYLGDALQPVLGSRYVTEVTERVYVEASGRTIEPDVAVIDRGPGIAGRSGSSASVDAPTLVVLEESEAREFFLEILDLAQGNRVVTIIEILSPSNKDPRSSGYALYRTKQKEVLESRTHLVEIDLLRAGDHTVAVPPLALPPRPPYRYLVSISRTEDRRKREVYRISLPQRLPRVPVPLSAPDPDAAVDLQAVFDKTYDNGAYVRRIDYAKPPDPPLSPEDELWRQEAIRARPAQSSSNL